jgi:small subunit ribosomal protein S17
LTSSLKLYIINNMSQKYRGTVIGLKNEKTATVKVIYNELHTKYFKPIKREKDYQVHNEKFDLHLGDEVIIRNSRPYSANKRFLVISKENTKN